MIYCNLKGGLGNMMFQIAAGLSIAIDNDTECCFPNLQSHLHYLDSDNVYNPELKHSSEYNNLFKDLITYNVSKAMKYTPFPFEYVEVPKITEDTLIDGFFQSEKYFKHNRGQILKAINFDFIDDDYIKNRYGFLNQNVTSIHVRRGDYVKHPNHHPVQSLEYYKTAIDLVDEKTDVYMVFSDDLNWCKEKFSDLKNVYFVENEKDYIEIYLMSKCKNNIISNSSFSWWGAWLNENDDKTVIGPLKWFGPAIQHNTGDVLPENWIKI